MSAKDLQVKAFRSLNDVRPYAEQMERLNGLSKRPCPFSTYDFLRVYLENEERGRIETLEALFLAAFRDDTLVGFLPLRKTVTRQFGVPFRTIEFLAVHDTDRMKVTALEDDVS